MTGHWQSARLHPPLILYGLLGVVLILGPAAILAVTIHVIVDLEHPRLGFFQIGDFAQLLVEVRASMR